MIKLSRLARFRQSRWYPIFWFIIFVLVFTAAATYFYLYGILQLGHKPSESRARSNQALATVQQHLAIKLSTNQMVATDDPTLGIKMSIHYQDDQGNDIPTDSDIIVTLSSTSPAGKFGTGTAATILQGTTATEIPYADSHAGVATLSAFVSGLTTASARLAVTAAPASSLAPISIVGHSGTQLNPNQDYTFATTLTDIYGNPVEGGRVVWTQQDTNASREAITNDTGQAYFVAHFIFTGHSHTTQVKAQFGGSIQQQNLNITS